MFAFVTNQSVENQAPDKTSCSMEVPFAWRIDSLYFKPTQSLLLSISQCTVPSIILFIFDAFVRVRFPNGCGYHIRSTYFCKILQPPQAHVHFCHFISGDYCITIPYSLISFVRENRSKPALYNGVNPVLIEFSKAKQQHDKVEWFIGII